MIAKNYMKFFVLIMCLGILAPGKAYGMNTFKHHYQTFKQNFTWKKTAIAGITGSCTLANYLIAGSIYKEFVPIEECLNDYETKKYYEKQFEQLPNVSPEVEFFIKKYLKESGVKDCGQIKVKRINGGNKASWGVVCTSKSTWFLVPANEARTLELAFDMQRVGLMKWMEEHERKITEQEHINLFTETIAIVNHEAAHIINGDQGRLKYAAMLAPLAGATCGIIIRKKFHSKKLVLVH